MAESQTAEGQLKSLISLRDIQQFSPCLHSLATMELKVDPKHSRFVAVVVVTLVKCTCSLKCLTAVPLEINKPELLMCTMIQLRVKETNINAVAYSYYIIANKQSYCLILIIIVVIIINVPIND